MTTYPTLKQWSSERSSVLAGVVPRIGLVLANKRRTLSAVRWRADLAVTAAEAIAETERLVVRFDADDVETEVLAVDLSTDVAVLRLSTAGPLQEQTAPTTPRLGDAIAIVGREPGGAAAVWGSVRLVGPAWRSRRGGEIAQRLELDARFDPHLEGGAVVDTQGSVIAMAVPGPYHRILGIPAVTIDQVVTRVERHGHLPRPYIGIRLQALWLDEPTRNQLGRSARRIPVVSGVDVGSPAAQAHVELGDLLLRVDGQPIESTDTLIQRITAAGPGHSVALEVLRAGKPVMVNVPVGERPHG
jgi:S1-C subfamily serine protease